MVGKSTLEKKPERLETALRPLERVNMDCYSSSITSIEGYNHAVIFTDRAAVENTDGNMKSRRKTISSEYARDGLPK